MKKLNIKKTGVFSVAALLLTGTIHAQLHTNDALFYNNGAEVSVGLGALLTIQGDFTTNGAGQAGTHLTNNGFIWVQGNVYGDNSFKQAGTGTLRLQNKTALYAAPYAGESYQVISGGYSVKGGQSKIGATDDGSFFALELDNANGIVYIKNNTDVRGSVNFKPGTANVAGQSIASNGTVNRLITNDPAVALPTTGSGYSAVFGLMNTSATLDSFKNNTITVNNSMISGIDNGYVQGKLRRAIPAAGATNLGFPLGLEPGTGNGQGLQYARMTFAANTHDVITGYFEKGLSNAGTYATQCNGDPDYFYGADFGQWDFKSAGNDAASQYSISIYPQHYGSTERQSYFVTKDNAIAGQSNQCSTNPIGLTRAGLTGFSTFGFAGAQIIYPNLWPSIDIDNSSFNTSLAPRDFIVNIYEIANVATNGSAFGIRIQKPLSFDITVPGITLSATDQNGISTTSDVIGGTANNNGDFSFRETADYIFITSRSGLVMPSQGTFKLGFTVKRRSGVSYNTKETITAIITPRANETNNTDNRTKLTLSTVL